MKNQKNRSMKVHAQSGYNYKATPTIILKGQWLQEMGFKIGDYISVSCEDGKLIITPDAEKAAMAKAEAEFRKVMKAGDKVVFSGGIYGKVHSVGETTVEVEVANGIVLTVEKNMIQPVVQTQQK